MAEEEPKTKTPDSVPEVVSTIEWIPSEDGVLDIYSNILYANWTLYDLRFRLGQIVADPRKQPEKAPWAIIERAVVTMPWGQVKYVRDLLNDCINRYEKANGEITIPKMPI